jgi:hypothetical protein
MSSCQTPYQVLWLRCFGAAPQHDNTIMVFAQLQTMFR